jgi:hypothetical protein
MSLLPTSNVYTREEKEFVNYGQQQINTTLINSPIISALMTIAPLAAVALVVHTVQKTLFHMNAISYISMLIGTHSHETCTIALAI